MRAVTRSVLAAAAAGSLSAALLPSVAGAAEYPAPAAAGAHDGVASEKSRWRPDNLPNPLAEKQAALRQKALMKVMRGKAEVMRRGANSNVVKLGPKQYVEVSREASDTDPDQIFTILVDFGKRYKAEGPNGEEIPLGIPGPVHNQIPKPDRDEDNTTYWRDKFPRSHYLDLMFGSKNSMAHFYKKQSWGKYAVDGDVSNWVKLPFRESRYGYDENQADGYWTYVKHTAREWYQDKRDNAGWSDERIREYLQRFDEWDRYDYDGDGNFQESDGYIDHFQAVHAGEGQEAGAPDWTIWSHRWYAFPTLFGVAGPPGYAEFGGVPIGQSGIWIGDYFTAPENGGLGVFAHEFGHDLGLADYYDTAGGDNSTGFWTLMSAGSWMSKSKWNIGTKPSFMGPHEKFLLGWLDYQYMPYQPDGEARDAHLNPAAIQTGYRDGTSNTAQALIVGLPQATKTVEYTDPHSGEWTWWGGSADNLNSTLTYTGMEIPNATSAELTAWAWYDIEEGYDYLYLEAKPTGTPDSEYVQINEADHPDGGIDGSTTEWEQLEYDLSEYTGETIDLRWRYQTDVGVHYAGPFLDDIEVTAGGERVYFTDVEDADGDGWVPEDTWKRSTGSETTTASQYYIAENRRYLLYDRVLRTGPYNFGWAYTRPDWVERFPYQDGMLVWFWNNLYEDNNTSEHPGHGWVLPVDSRPKPITFADGSLLGNRRQPFDATFGTGVTDAVRFHRQIEEEDGDIRTMVARVPSRHMKEVFDDSRKKRYWTKANPWGSVKVAGTGTEIKVLYETSGGYRMDLQVTQAPEEAAR